MANADANADAMQNDSTTDAVDASDQAVPPAPDTSFGGRLLQALPDHMTESIKDEDKAEFGEIADKVRGAYWTGAHAVDARYTLPWFSKRFYMRIMAGQENRDPNRVKSENREKSVSRSAVNVAGIGVGVLVFYIVVGIVLLGMSIFL